MKKLIVSVIGLLAFATSALAQIGSIDKDLVYTPVTPCRVLDTRPSQGGSGPISAGGTGSYYAAGLASYASYGGSATNCGLSIGTNNIAAVAVNFTVVTPASAGYITVYPYAGTQPTASTLNFTAGAILANSAIVKVSQNGLTAMSIFSTATTDVIADVVGYYSRPVSAGSFECVDVAGAGVVVAANGYSFIQPAVCAAGFTSVGVNFAAGSRVVKADSGRDYLYVLNLNSIPQTVTPYTNCCRIPGR
jgi:hypothetical protein